MIIPYKALLFRTMEMKVVDYVVAKHNIGDIKECSVGLINDISGKRSSN